METWSYDHMNSIDWAGWTKQGRTTLNSSDLSSFFWKFSDYFMLRSEIHYKVRVFGSINSTEFVWMLVELSWYNLTLVDFRISVVDPAIKFSG